MSNRLLFVYNNVKVSLNPHDQPFPGFETLTWDPETEVIGTLWDLGLDAGLTIIGQTKIQGQLWLAHELDALKDIEDFLGVRSQLFEMIELPVVITDRISGFRETVKAKAYRLTRIEKDYKIVPDGRWIPKRV